MDSEQLLYNKDLHRNKEQIKQACTADKVAAWIANERGEKASKSGNEWRVGAKHRGGSIVVTQTETGAIICDHNACGLQGGDVFQVVCDLRGCNFSESLDIAGREIACMSFETECIKPEINGKCAQCTPKDRKVIYEQWMQRYKHVVVNGLQSKLFAEMMKARGLDASKIATLDRVGFCIDETQWANCDNRKIKGFKAPGKSIVFWDDTEYTIKAIPLDQKTGKRTGEPIQLGSCQWRPFKTIGDNVYLCEGETSAIALIFAGINNGIANAIPCKPESKNTALIEKLCSECKNIYLAYDNDNAGREYTKRALKIAKDAIDISDLWSGEDWREGDDPNDFVKRYKDAGIKITERIKAQEMPQENAQETAPKIDTSNIEELRAYCLKKARDKDSKFAKIALNDPVVGGFINLVDPYRMRSHAPVFCLVTYAVANLAHYNFGLYTQSRIINLVAKTGAGKDWVLGTDKDGRSKSLFVQLGKNDGISVDYSADASITGNGMSKAAFLWASNDANKDRVRGMFRPEFGTAQTRGYGVVERAGSIGGYDMALDYGRIKKPTNKADLKELKDYKSEYAYNAFEVRAYQDINGARVVAPRFQGNGEARREFWFYMSSPDEDTTICNIRNSFDFDNLLKTSAFMPESNEKAFNLLRDNILPFEPKHETFESLNTEILVDAGSNDYKEAFLGLLDVVKNTYYLDRNGFLLKDKLQYCTALSAGLHGRTKAAQIDYQIGAYFCECLCDSLDSILECAGTVDAPESEIAQIMQRVKDNGANGVYKKNLSNNKRLLDELRGIHKTASGDIYFDDDAPLIGLRDDKSYKYFAAEFLNAALKRHKGWRRF